MIIIELLNKFQCPSQVKVSPAQTQVLGLQLGGIDGDVKHLKVKTTNFIKQCTTIRID